MDYTEGYWGDLHDYQTGAYLRPATRREYEASLHAGPEGAFTDASAPDRALCVIGDPE